MTAEELASAALEALNVLGHVASVQPWEELRQVEGDAALQASLERASKRCLELLQRVQRGANPSVFPRPADAEQALRQMLALLPALTMDDTAAVSQIRDYARQALEAMGFALRS